MVAESETFQGLLGDVRAFCELVDFGSISAAARRLGQSKGAISRRITRLEKLLGARLVARTSRAVTVTEEGNAFYVKSRAALVLIDEAADGARGLHDVARGHLRITTPIDLSVHVLPPIIADFLALYPQITVEIIATDAMIDLAAHRIDLAVRIGVGDLPDQMYYALELCETSLGMYASPRWLAANVLPKRPEAMAGCSFLVSDKSGVGRALPLSNRRGKTIEVAGRAIVRASDMATVLGLAEAGAGIALLPDLITRDALRRGTLQPVLAEWSLRGVRLYALSIAGRQAPARTRLFREFLRARLAAS